MIVLLIEAELKVADLIRRGLTAEGWIVVLAADLRTTLERLETTNSDVILLDLEVPGVDGLAIINALRERGDATPVIVLTALEEDDERVVALRDAGADYLRKPFDFDVLVSRLSDLAAGQHTAMA